MTVEAAFAPLYHLFHLIGRSLHALPSIVGLNTLELVVPCIAFIAALAVFVTRTGWQELKKSWKDSVVQSAMAAAIAWIYAFLFCVAMTTYRDHMALAATVRLLSQPTRVSLEKVKTPTESRKDETNCPLFDLKTKKDQP